MLSGIDIIRAQGHPGPRRPRPEQHIVQLRKKCSVLLFNKCCPNKHIHARHAYTYVCVGLAANWPTICKNFQESRTVLCSATVISGYTGCLVIFQNHSRDCAQVQLLVMQCAIRDGVRLNMRRNMRRNVRQLPQPLAKPVGVRIGATIIYTLVFTGSYCVTLLTLRSRPNGPASDRVDGS